MNVHDQDQCVGMTPVDAARGRLRIITAICLSATEYLGDCYDGKQMFLASRLVRRQVETLIALDPDFRHAFRSFVMGRIASCCPIDDTEVVDRILSDAHDPGHAYWLAIAPSDPFRIYCRGNLSPVPSIAEQIRTAMGGAFRIGPDGPEPLRPETD